jgi:hypothetical protein
MASMLNIDRHIALQAGWIAGPAFGVAMMAAPTYFHLESAVASGFLFWGGLGMFLATILVVFLLSIHEEKERKRVVGPIILMAIGALVFGGGAAWYFWPKSEPATATNAAKPWKHTLEDLYAMDFSDLGSTERSIEAALQSKDHPEQQFQYNIRFRLYHDFRSNTEFVSLFIPVSNQVDKDGRIFDLIKLLPDEIRKQQSQLQKDIGIGMSAPGVPYRESKDLTFAGRVFIYTMYPFTVVQLGELVTFYQSSGMQLDIRGNDYWWSNKDR